MMMGGGHRFVLGLVWAAIAVPAVVGSVHAQAGPDALAPRLKDVDEDAPRDRLHYFAGRLSVHVNGAYQPTVRRYARSTAFQVYGERARFLTEEEFEGQTHVDAGGAFRIWRRLEVGASYAQVSKSSTAVVTGAVPHPLDVGRDRLVAAKTLALPHRERSTHVYAAWRFRRRDAWSLALSAGPTYFNLRQRSVAYLAPGETGGPPFSDVDLQVGTGEHTRNGIGFNVGADFTVMFPRLGWMPRLGVGYFVRLTLGTIGVPSTTRTENIYYVGGVQTGGGLRVQF